MSPYRLPTKSSTHVKGILTEEDRTPGGPPNSYPTSDLGTRLLTSDLSGRDPYLGFIQRKIYTIRPLQ